MPEKKWILCVDDDDDDRDFICEAVKEIDPTVDVLHASNGLLACNMLTAFTETHEFPCLIIMDINMPIMNGREALAKIKSKRELEEIPVVMFSTSSHISDRKFCEQYNVELVTKPGNMKIIKKEVKRLLTHCS